MAAIRSRPISGLHSISTKNMQSPAAKMCPGHSEKACSLYDWNTIIMLSVKQYIGLYRALGPIIPK